MRTQFGKPGQKIETPLIEYPLHQYRLFPLVANTVATMFVGGRILELWGKNIKRLFIPNNPKLIELHALVSVSKSLSSWTGYKGVQECRQACGGNGYSFYSRFSFIMNNMDVT